MPATNVTRYLDSLGVAYRVASYEADPEDLSAASVALKVGLPAERVFKTLALTGDRGGIFLCCAPGDSEVDLKKAAKATSQKSVRMLPLKDLLGATGYVRGGCSPIGTKRAYEVLVDESAILHAEIAVSAGVRGCQVVMAPDDLIRALGNRASYADLV